MRYPGQRPEPEPTRTPALDKAATDLEVAQALREKIVDQVPPGRLGEPLEIASAAVFLASNEPRCMYGTEILVDGGVRHLKKGARARSWWAGRKLNRRRAPARPPARPGSRIARRYPRYRR
ncbi:TPA: SDR family oxidoreductase [Pseudomonas aeruginosa]